MGYEDAFYAPVNIIGYTGNVHDKPTVYFKNGARFGHITQDHKNKENIGREKVHTNKNYRIENVDIPKKGMRAVEYIGQRSFHTSRNTFTALDANDNKTKNLLAQAIENFKTMKEICLDANYPNLDES